MLGALETVSAYQYAPTFVAITDSIRPTKLRLDENGYLSIMTYAMPKDGIL